MERKLFGLGQYKKRSQLFNWIIIVLPGNHPLYLTSQITIPRCAKNYSCTSDNGFYTEKLNYFRILTDAFKYDLLGADF